MDTSRPIGYWLKHLHDLLEEQFDVTLADLGLERRHWQVLNTLGGGPHPSDALRGALAPFRSGGGPDLEEVLEGLEARGWTGVDDGGSVVLTPEGRAAREEAAARVAGVRATLLTGLTPEQYAETVRVLAVMAGNVEAALAGRPGRRNGGR